MAVEGYAEYKPTLWERLGFRHRHDEEIFQWRMQEPQEEGFCDGYMISDAHAHLDWLDRLRVLISGHCAIKVYTKTDIMPNRLQSRSVFSVLPPGR